MITKYFYSCKVWGRGLVLIAQPWECIFYATWTTRVSAVRRGGGATRNQDEGAPQKGRVLINVIPLTSEHRRYFGHKALDRPNRYTTRFILHSLHNLLHLQETQNSFIQRQNQSGLVTYSGSCHKRQKPQAPTPQAPIRNRQTRKVANAKGLNRNTNLV